MKIVIREAIPLQNKGILVPVKLNAPGGRTELGQTVCGASEAVVGDNTEQRLTRAGP
jgi:hypothetical protein